MRKRLSFALLLALLCPKAQATAQEDSIVGVASYYADRFHGRKTASGEVYDKNEYTCAHLKFKFGTKLLVRNLKTGKEVVVRVTDRGPYSKKYTIDLSRAAAEELGIIRAGHAKVSIFPYNAPEPSLLDKIPTFFEFRETIDLLPYYNFKESPKITPKLLPLPQADKK